MPPSRPAATAYRSAHACNGAISTACSSIPSAPPPSARGCCTISSRSREDAPHMRLIPAIDLKSGRCVRLLQGDFAAETRYGADPLALLGKYRDFGADWLHVVDLDGARDGSVGNRAIIADLVGQNAIKLQVGGGLRNTAAVAQMLDQGAA